MKIIKQGYLPADILKKKTCSKCHTKFEYTSADIKADRDGDYIVCPYKPCGQFIGVTHKSAK